MVRKLLKLVKEKLTGSKKEDTSNKTEKDNNQSWEKRKAELMAKARQKQVVSKTRVNKQRKPSAKTTQKKNEQKPDNRQKKNETKNDDSKNRQSNVKNNNRRNRHQNRNGNHKKTYQQNKIVKKEPNNWDINIFDVPKEEGKTRFHKFNLQPELMHAIYDLGFKYCTPIQEAILESTLNGKDATGKAQTGTGKTAAFLITLINKFLSNPPKGVRRPGAPRALIIAPTRELVMQIASDAKKLTKYSNISVVEVYGGMDFNKQQRKLRGSTTDILVATPGRLLDFQSKRDVFLGSVETLVIDEADRMLDMGFIPDVRKIIHSTPSKSKRQTLFFSATITDEVKRLAHLWTKEAINVEIDPEKVAGDSVKQVVYIVTNDEKFPLLYNMIQQENLERVIVFANRKDEAHPLQVQFRKYGIDCEVLSGDVEQKKRIRTLNNFKEGKIKVLVATDVASRGIHVEDISHVVNYTLPQDPEDYVHRIGRTGRAGATGTSISFASEDDSFYIPAIEKFLGHKLECIYPDEKLLEVPKPEKSIKFNESNKVHVTHEIESSKSLNQDNTGNKLDNI